MFSSANAPVNPSERGRDRIGRHTPEHIVAEGVDVAGAIGLSGRRAELSCWPEWCQALLRNYRVCTDAED